MGGEQTVSNSLWELVGDVMLVAFGLILIFIFYTIEIAGSYGHEPNRYIRWVELVMGVPLILLGIDRFLEDVRK